MKKNIAKVILLCSLFTLFSTTMFAENAIVTSIKGKVEVNHGDDKWMSLSVGDKVLESDIVSTGFQSEAKIKYNGSVMLLGALTRVTLKQLSSTASTDKVDVFLNTGAVRSKVTHTDDKKVNYQVRGAVAVASVRGTEFTARADGSVECYSGAVAVYPAKFYVEEVQEESTEAEEVPAGSEEASETTEEASAEEGENQEAAAEASSDNSTETTTTETAATESTTTTETVVAENAAPEQTTTNEVAQTTETTQTTTATQAPATATTPANEINSNAPSNATVVGQNQTAKVSTTGSVEKPITVSTKKVNKVKAAITTAAEKETVATSTTTVVDTPTIVEPQKGYISVKIEFEEN